MKVDSLHNSFYRILKYLKKCIKRGTFSLFSNEKITGYPYTTSCKFVKRETVIATIFFLASW